MSVRKPYSIYRGVDFHCGRWRGQSAVRGKVTHLGSFDTPEEAAIAVNNEWAKYAPWRGVPNSTLPTSYHRPEGEAVPQKPTHKKPKARRKKGLTPAPTPVPALEPTPVPFTSSSETTALRKLLHVTGGESFQVLENNWGYPEGWPFK